MNRQKFIGDDRKPPLKSVKLIIENIDLLTTQELVNLDFAIHNELKDRYSDTKRDAFPLYAGSKPIENDCE